MILVVQDPNQVLKYLEKVQTTGDQNRNKLGFLSRSVYEDLCLQGKLWVAVDESKKEYVGHLLFGGTYPQLKVFQIFVVPNCRRQGVAQNLIKELKWHGERLGFSSIRARVAEDLDDSNEFWSSLGFVANSLVEGGKTTKRKIIIRVLQLNVPSLFDSLDDTGSKGLAKHLSFKEGSHLRSRTFAIDVNVYLDVTKEREKYEAAAAIVRSSLSGNFKLCFTKELLNELIRNTDKYANDPILQLAKNLPVLPDVEQIVLRPLIEKIRELIFSNAASSNLQSPQSLSDLRHIAMSIHHDVDGFITRDKAILAASQVIKEEFGIEILSSSDFSATDTISSFAGLNPIIADNQFLDVREFRESDRANARALLRDLGVSENSVKVALRPGTELDPSRRLILEIDGLVQGLASWRIPSSVENEATCFLFVNEDSEPSQQFIEHVLERYTREVSLNTGRHLYLFVSASQTGSQSIASNSMYTPAPELNRERGLICFRKFAVSGIVTTDNWSKFTQSMKEHVGVSFPEQMPDHAIVQRDGIKLFKNNNKIEFVDLFDIESYFSNVLVLFPSRQGVIVPIRPAYSEELLGKADDQNPLFGKFDAWLKTERTYFRKPIASGKAGSGDPIIFYSSQRAKEAIGCGRITYSRVANVESIDAQISKTGVLTKKELNNRADERGNIHIISFDGFQQFINPVSLQKLKKVGAGQANFQTIERIEADTLKRICQLGFGHVKN